MQFASTSYWIFLSALAVFVLFIFQSARKKNRLAKFADQGLLENLVPNFQSLLFRRKLLSINLFLATFFIAIALLRPQWGFTLKETKNKGVDLVVAMDVSESMLAQDLKPNRLQRAKRELSDLLEHLQGDRLALLTFAGTAFIEVPLTNDYGMIHQFINELDTSLIPVPGTNISEALDKSITALIGEQTEKNGVSKRGKGIILITDGEDLNSDLSVIKKKAKKNNIRIYIIGVGTEEGAPIPTYGGYKRDRSENIIVSRLNVSALKSLAHETGGKFVASLGSEGDIVSIYEDGIKNDLEGSITKGSKSKLWNEYFQYPLALGILFLILGMLVEQELIKFPLRNTSGKNV